ncbi:MAG: anti-sigma factor [Actinobacteria bacterium]|nr:anti-sigma factor [Actinomycetota bacterium]
MASGIHELAAGYALDALDEPEREEFEEHLTSCARCREEVASFQEVAAALAIHAATGPAPEPALRRRVVAAAREERQNVVPIGRRRLDGLPGLATLTTVAAAAVLVLAIWALSLRGDLKDARLALRMNKDVTALLADPGARRVALAAGDGQVVVDGKGRAVLVLNRLRPITDGRTYEAWVIEDGVATRAGLFDGGGARTIVPIEVPVPDGGIVAVTVEAAGGVDRPTRQPIIASSPV